MDDEKKYKIDILLKEYETLRQEILARTGHRFVLVSLAGGLMGFLITTLFTTKAHPSLVVYIFALVGAIVLGVIWRRFQLLIEQLSEGIVRIEHRINDLADDAELLKWEKKQQLQRSVSFLRRARALLLRESK